jgi:hypothetical protein
MSNKMTVSTRIHSILKLMKVWAVLSIAWGLVLFVNQPSHFFNSLKYSISAQQYKNEMREQRVVEINQLIDRLKQRIEEDKAPRKTGDLSYLIGWWGANDKGLFALASPGVRDVRSVEELSTMITMLEKLKENKERLEKGFEDVHDRYFEIPALWLKPSLTALIIALSITLLSPTIWARLSLNLTAVASGVRGLFNTQKSPMVIGAFFISVVLIGTMVTLDYFSPVKTCIRSYIKVEKGHPDEVLVDAVRTCSRNRVHSESIDLQNGKAAEDIEESFFNRLERLLLVFAN